MKKMSRRAWLASLLPTATDLVVGAVESKFKSSGPIPLRPPGAVTEPLFLALCTGCGDCSAACPHAAVFVFDKGLELGGATPHMRPAERSCHMCEGFPCAVACDEGALVPPATSTWPLGVARIKESLCIAFLGPECGACVGLCPPGAESIQLARWKPQLDAATCVGCGLCVEACPTMPKAIEITETPLARPVFEPIKKDEEAPANEGADLLAKAEPGLPAEET
jgi:ferredoxin-type protein NapG